MSRIRPRSGIVVLVVEDEAVIRMVAADALHDAGFMVIEAEDGDHALQMLRLQADGIHAVFTDVNMPSAINGIALVLEASRCWPWLHLLVTSGQVLPEAVELPNECCFMPKPYRMAHLVDHMTKVTAFH